MKLYTFQSNRAPNIFGFTADPEGANLPVNKGLWYRTGSTVPLGLTMASTPAEIHEEIGRTGYALVKGYPIPPTRGRRKSTSANSPRPTLSSMDESVRRIFAAKLKKLRLARGWTQKDLASKAGIRVDLLERLEGSAVDPELMVLVVLAKALGVRAQVLWP
jgi:DNA-binding XRE family transcriptional regulator